MKYSDILSISLIIAQGNHMLTDDSLKHMTNYVASNTTLSQI